MNQNKKESNEKEKELNQKRKERNQEKEGSSPARVSKDQQKEEDEGIMMESEEYHDHSYQGPVSKLPSGFIDSNLRMAHMERRHGSRSDSDDHDEDVDNMFYKRRSSMSFDPTSKRVLFPPTSYSFVQQGSPRTQRRSSNQFMPGSHAHSGQRSPRRQSRQSLPSLQLAPSLLALPPWNESHHAEGKKKHRKRSPNLVSPVSDDEITPVIEQDENPLFTSRHQRRASSVGRLTWSDDQNGGSGYFGAPPSHNQQNNTEPEDEPFDRRSPRHPRPRRGSFRKEEESSSCVIT